MLEVKARSVDICSKNINPRLYLLLVRILKMKYAAESSSKPLLKLTSYLVFSITKSLLYIVKWNTNTSEFWKHVIKSNKTQQSN